MMKIDPELRDIWLWAGASIVAAFIAREAAQVWVWLPENWVAVATVVAGLGAQIVLKLAMPSHLILSRFSWSYMIIVVAIIVSIVTLVTNVRLLGFLVTAATVLGLILLYVIVHLTIGPKDDASAEKQ